MKKLHLLSVLAILVGLFSSSLSAQDSEIGKIKELYLSGNLLTFSNFGLQYKSELKNGNFFRIGVTDISSDLTKYNPGSISGLLPSTSTYFEGNFEVGLEKRAQITNRLAAFYGINFITSTRFQRIKREDPTLPRDLRHLDDITINPGLAFNSGFIVKITDEFFISTEIIPRLLIKYSSSERISGLDKVKDTHSGGSFNLDNQSVRVSIIYKWIKM